MSNILAHLEPKEVFRYFEELAAIPHGSGNTKQIADYCEQFAFSRGLQHSRDSHDNVIIVKPAAKGYENAAPIVLQGHLDMVCEKDMDCPLDMEKEGLDVTHDDKFVFAKGTTLGGDDGIAVAYALAVLDADDIPHPALEVVLTVCEEVGLLGASAMDFSDLAGRLLINIDSEEEGVLTAG